MVIQLPKIYKIKTVKTVKLLKTVLLPRLSKNVEQTSQQFWFTKGLSPVMSALIVSEARAEAKLNPCAPLFLMTMDSQKAFDVVNHTILLDVVCSGCSPLVVDYSKRLVFRVNYESQMDGGTEWQFNKESGGYTVTLVIQNLPTFNRTQTAPSGSMYCGCPLCADDLTLIGNMWKWTSTDGQQNQMLYFWKIINQ